ncbi:hypothetical protein [Paraburkholderia sp. 35.1]|uniref:hypothetical protein n=1 Tax=Paraburkholderia sp. 35.1 TaxID=2991058 RepID=UPI003D1C6481
MCKPLPEGIHLDLRLDPGVLKRARTYARARGVTLDELFALGANYLMEQSAPLPEDRAPDDGRDDNGQ